MTVKKLDQQKCTGCGAALRREENRAGHFREDFPARDDKNWFKWITIEQKKGAPGLSTLPVPLPKYRWQP
jgi:succinate dehydrogenase / fumarate reductase flavoprotein subunit